MKMEPDLQKEGGDGKDETAAGVRECVQISQGGKFAATSIPRSLVMVLQAVKVEGKRKPEVSWCLNPSHSLILKDSYLPLIRFDLYSVDK